MQLNDANKTLALAGIFQAAELIKQLANTGEVDKIAYEASLQSICMLDAPTAESIFGSAERVKIGLKSLLRYGTKNPPFDDTVLFRMVLNMMRLARKILHDKTLFKQLKNRLGPIASLAQHFPIDDKAIITPMATLYTHVFLENQLRIPVMGRVDLVQNPAIIERVRALLLAGIRAAVLWYQVGGNRFQLFFARVRLYEQANELQRSGQ